MTEQQTIQQIPTLVNTFRQNWEKIGSKPRTYEWRYQQLTQMKKLLEEHSEAIQEAYTKDMNQTKFMRFVEVELGMQEVIFAMKNLKQWMQEEIIDERGIMNVPGTPKLIKEPLGVVLVIGTWNYPITTFIKPAIGAIAAGNCVVLKPSEISIHCSSLFAKLIPQYFDKDHIAVVEGGPEVIQTLLKQKFDHIFFTGSPTVGKIVMSAAAQHLTPVTLELGGKSPCIIDDSANMSKTIERLAWGKFLNAGQTCVAPDYVLISKSREQEFIDKMKGTIKRFYGDEPQKSKDLSRIINSRHTSRVIALIQQVQDKVVIGGTFDEADRYIAPTVILNPSLESNIMKEEIFGPVLPVISVSNLEEAIKVIKSKPRPLALYIFSTDQKNIDFIMENTNSGGVCVNHCVQHTSLKTLPFGGIGESGIGRANGKYTFDAFTHEKPVLVKPNYDLSSSLYPPYKDGDLKMLKYIARIQLPNIAKLKTVLKYTAFAAAIAATTLVANSKYGPFALPSWAK